MKRPAKGSIRTVPPTGLKHASCICIRVRDEATARPSPFLPLQYTSDCLCKFLCMHDGYVCGCVLILSSSDAKAMARDVNTVLLEIVQEHGGKTLEEATAFVKSMKSKGHYVVDAWS